MRMSIIHNSDKFRDAPPTLVTVANSHIMVTPGTSLTFIILRFINQMSPYKLQLDAGGR